MTMLNPIPYYRLARWLYVRRIPFLPRVIDRLIEFVFHCRLPYTIEIGEGFELGHYGLGVFIHPRARIGRNVFFGPCVHLGGRSQRWEVPQIEDNVYVATGAKILGDVVVGEGSVVGANAVVIHSVPQRSAVGGVPARVVRENIKIYDYTGWPESQAPSTCKASPSKSNRTEEGVARVFYLANSLGQGGSENQMVEVARRLNSGDYRLTVGCLQAEGSSIDVLQQAGIPVVEFTLRGGLLRPSGFYQLFRLALFLHRARFDVVHTHDLWSNLMGVPAAWVARVPVIISSRRDLAHWWWYTPRRRKILRHIQSLSSFILVNCDAVRDFLVKEDGFNASKIRVIRNAVDFARFANTSRDRKRLFPHLNRHHKLLAIVANMNIPVKGHTYLIQAARRICSVFPKTRFVLIGDGRQRPKLEQQVRDVGLQENFLFLGRRKDVPELLACCDLSVLPSTAEGLPNAVLESLAAGVPVVATRVGGTVEIIEDRVSGLLVPPRDPEALADRILELLKDPSLAQKLARAGQDRVRTYFNFDRLLLELKELYDEPRLKEGAKREQSQRKEERRWVRAPDPATVGLEELELTSPEAAQLHQSGKPR